MKENFSAWWRGLAFKSKVFLLIFAAFSLTVMLVELVIEPVLENQIFGNGFDELDWHEVPQWVVAAIVIGLLGASVITRAIMRRVGRIASATDDIANGNLTARIDDPGRPQDAFGRLSRSINAMAETIEHLFTNERRLLSDISHELRSPLTRIGAAVELLSMHARDDTSQDLIRRVERDLSHMNHLVELLLEQSINRLAVREGRERIDASALLSEVVDACRLKGATENKAIIATIDDGLTVDCHPLQIRLIAENLLGNALFYAPPETDIEFSAVKEGGTVLIRVRDYGPGVPDNTLNAIFTPFFRVDASRSRKSGGVGLGLNLVQEACLALGGSVHAENAGPGLAVTVSLPAAEVV